MRLTVKILNGKECTVAASPSSTVMDVKQQVLALLSIPITDQKLLHLGRPLADDKKLGDYNIADGGKLILVVKKTSGSGGSSSASADVTQLPPVWQTLLIFLKRHFTEKDSELVLAEFRKSFDKGLSSLSLDDIERMAKSKLRREEVYS